MKKLVLTIGIAVGLIGTSFGQGYISVTGTQTSSTTATLLTSAYTGGAAGGATFVGGPVNSLYLCAILTSTNATPSTQLLGNSTALSGWLDTGIQGGNNTFAGRLVAGSGDLAANAPAGNTQDWLVVSWSVSLGYANWTALSAALANGTFTNPGYIGWSLIGTGAAGAASPGVPLALTGGAGIIQNGWTMEAVAVPEPTTIALASLGGVALLAFRRRKA